MRAAVLGSPIAHSLSPVLHRAAYEALGLVGWTYDAVEVTAADLEAFLDGVGAGWSGLSLTMPLKEAVLPLLDAVDALVERTRAANTVVVQDGRLLGHNTDVDGIREALRGAGVDHPGRAVVLGSGATARSALAALEELSAGEVLVVARRDPGGVAWRPWGPDAVRGADLVVSAVPAGAADELATAVEDVPALLDVVYSPWPSALARACRGKVVGGAEMLLHQAAGQVLLMTGRPAPLPAMRLALEAASEGRG